MDRLDDLRIRQLDAALEPFQSVRDRSPPKRGWARAVRTALGMSLRQLAERTGLSKTAVRSAETNEARGTAQLRTLQALAEAMECDLVYALVPRGSLEDVVARQAERKAEGLVRRVSASMELEDQGVGIADRRRQVQDLKADILRDRRRDFWDV